MPNRYTQLLEANIPNEIFVRRALGLLEADLREMALLSLQQWAETDIVSEDLFKAIAMMVRPTWGTWNNLLIELRNLRSDTLQTAGVKIREKVQQKKTLKNILNHLQQSLDLDEIEVWLTPLYKLLTPQKMPRDFSLQQLLASPIPLRNHISHGNPTSADYWDSLATHFHPLIQWLSQQQDYLQLCQSAPHNTPWFLASDEGLLTYNGIHNKDISYSSPDGASIKNREMLAQVSPIFQTLMGKADLQYKQFRELLGKLAPEELKGVFLGDFLLGKPIGKGAHGIVHKGIHLGTGRQVAIKLLKDSISENKEIQKRFKQEAELLSRFNSPHIVKIFGYADATWQAPKDISLKGEAWYTQFKKGDKHKTFIAMEWIEGQTLDEIYASTSSVQVASTSSARLTLKNSAQHNLPVDFPKITQWFVDACTAIEQVHQMKFIHRDIKPSNLMIDKDGTIKLMDFGIARALQSNSPQITQDLRDMLGTPAYMAPEQIRLLDAEAEVGKGADIYGLSAVFYELYTQQRLFDHHKETIQTIKAIKKKGTQRPLPPIDCNKKIPWALDIILKGGLENEVTDRYRSVTHLKRDLVHYQKDEAIEYKKPTVLRRSGLWYRRNRRVVNISLFFITLLIGATLWYIVNITQAEKRAKDERDRAIDLINYMNFDLRDKLKLTGKLNILDGVQQRINQYFDSIEISQSNLNDWRQKAIALMQHAQTLNKQGKSKQKQVERGLLEAKQIFERLAKERSLAIHKKLSEQNPSNLQLKRNLLVVYKELGDYYLQSNEKDKIAQVSQNALAIRKKLFTDPISQQWQRDLPVSYDVLGDFYLQNNKKDKAAKMYQNALLIRKKIIKQDPNNVKWQHDLSISYQHIGDLYLQNGEKNKAIKMYEDLLTNTKKLVEQKPRNLQWQRELSISYDRLGDFYLQSGKKNKVVKMYQNAFDIHKRLAEKDTRNVQWQRDLSISYQRLGSFFARYGKKDKTTKLYQDYLVITQKLVKQDPSNMQWQYDLLLSYSILSDFYLKHGEREKATELFKDILKLTKKLEKRDPSNVQWQHALLGSYQRLGNFYLKHGEREKVTELFENALKITKKLTKQNSNNVQWQRDLSVSYELLANFHLQNGEATKAEKMYYDILSIRKKLATQDPSNVQWQRGLSISYEQLANFHLQNGEVTKAEKMYHDTVAIREKLTTQNPSNVKWQHDLSISYERLANFHQKNGEVTKAKKMYLGTLAISAKLATKDPSNVQWQRSLSISYEKMANFYLQNGESTKAEKMYQDALAISAKLAMKDPSNVQWQHDLSISYSKMGDLAIKNKDSQSGIKWYVKTLKIIENLAKNNQNVIRYLLDSAEYHYKLSRLISEKQDTYYQKAERILQTAKQAGKLSKADETYFTSMKRELGIK